MREPVAGSRGQRDTGQVRAHHPVAVDGGVLGGKGRLQRADRSGGSRGRGASGHARAAPPAAASAATWVASEAAMLAISWASDGDAVASWRSRAVAAACSAACRNETAGPAPAGTLPGAGDLRAGKDVDGAGAAALPGGTIRRDRSVARCA